MSHRFMLDDDSMSLRDTVEVSIMIHVVAFVLVCIAIHALALGILFALVNDWGLSFGIWFLVNYILGPVVMFREVKLSLRADD